MGAGVGQGVLAVGGDLSVVGALSFHGVVLVRGRVKLEAGAYIRGFVVAGGGVSVSATSRVEASACAGLMAVRGVTDLLGAVLTVPGAERLRMNP